LNGKEKKYPGFPLEIYDNLPKVLRYPCREVLKERVEKEVFLVGAIGVISGVLPNLTGFYDGQYYGPNLYVYVLAPYGSGKGALKYARELAKPIHQSLKEEGQTKLAEYQMEMQEFDAGNRTEPPQKPGNLMLFLPANNSKTGLLQLLDDNKGRGVLFETEGDTLADALDQKHGNFSDALRKAFQHEPTSYYRRTDREHKEIETPELSVILSVPINPNLPPYFN